MSTTQKQELAPVAYASEHRAYEPTGYDGIKMEVLNWPARSEWETLAGGNKQLADYLDYAAMEHTRVRGFKKARDGRTPLSLDVRECKSSTWGKDEKAKPDAAALISAMNPEERKAFLMAQLAAMEQG